MADYISKFQYNGTTWDMKDAEARQALALCVNNGYYDSNAKKIILRHDSTTIVQIDATDFIKDGMVSNVQVVNGYLVITFNTDAGQEPIRIPITDIFNPDNYYTKSATNGLLALKQDIIQDLAQIRQGASAGATAVQPAAMSAALVDTVAESGVFDLSAYNAANGVLATYANLSAALTALNALPAAYKKGGMSFKFIQGTAQSSDNKYVQHQLTKNTWSADEHDWTSGSGDGGGGEFDISAYNGGVVYDSLEDALSDIPVSERKAGMSIKFIQNASANNQEYAHYAFSGNSIENQVFNNLENWTLLSKSASDILIFNLDYDDDFTVDTSCHPTYGTVSSRAGFCCTTQMMEIPTGAVAVSACKFDDMVMFDNSSYAGFFFFDSNRTYLGRDYAKLGSMGAHIPSGASYMHITIAKEVVFMDNYHPDKIPVRIYLSEDTLPLVPKINNSGYLSLDWVKGTALRLSYDSGTISFQNQVGGIATPIPVNVRGVKSIGSNLLINNQSTAHGYYAVCCLYDKYGILISSYAPSTIEVPNNAVYARFANGNQDGWGNDIEKVFLYTGDDYFSKQDDETKREGYDTSMNAIPRTLYASINEMEYDCVTDTYLYYPINYQRFATWKSTKPIPVKKGDVFEFNLLKWGNNEIFVVCDENLNIIDRASDHGYSTSGTYYKSSITIERELARYIVFESRPFDVSHTPNLYIRQVKGFVTKNSIKDIDAVQEAYIAQMYQIRNALEAQGISIDVMPADYQVSVQKAIRNISELKNGKNTLSFAIFTDPHYMGASTGDTTHTYPRLMQSVKYLYDKGQIDFVMSCGDNVDSFGNTGSYDNFKQGLVSTGCPYGITVGNHDNGYPSVLRVGQYTIDGVVRGDDYNDTWYYFDKGDVRFIVMNTHDMQTETEHDLIPTNIFWKGMSRYQVDWLANTALQTDKKVVILMHIAPCFANDAASYGYVAEILHGFVSGTSGQIAYVVDSSTIVNIDYDFTEQGEGDILGVFTGHYHGDQIKYKDKNDVPYPVMWQEPYLSYKDDYNIIWIDNALDYNTIDGTRFMQEELVPNTYKEVAMDIVTIDLDSWDIYINRVGRGKHRMVWHNSSKN